MEVLASIVVGGLILTAIGVEYLRAPKMMLSIEEPPCDVAYARAALAHNARYLRLKLSNKRLPALAKWMLRTAALQCRGEITFHHLDGQDVFGRSMAMRWANSPQPIPNQIMDFQGRAVFQIVDYVRAASESRVDVYPGEEQIADVVARFDDEIDCYGWNNDAYAHQWRSPHRKLCPWEVHTKGGYLLLGSEMRRSLSHCE